MPWVRRLVKGSSTFTSPRSRTALVKKRAYSRCRTACSIPPMYWSTAIHRSTFAGSTGRVGSWGEQYRRKYQEESTKVSIVSVSRRAGPLHFGHFVFTNASDWASGEALLPVNGTSLGSITGRSAAGTGTVPHFWQSVI